MTGLMIVIDELGHTINGLRTELEMTRSQLTASQESERLLTEKLIAATSNGYVEPGMVETAGEVST